MPETLERTVLPPKEHEPLDELLEMFEKIATTELPPTTTISGPNGEKIILPAEIYQVLQDVVEAMSQDQAIMVAPVHQRLTTQEAADLLGISRPTLVKLLEEGEIPYEQPGRHRRVLLTDVLEYRERKSQGRREALDRMVEIAGESGMYEVTAKPKRTR
jgi:excisionase family DNA binding protein